MTRTELPWSEREIREMRTRLLEFFEERRRALPWRDAGSWGVLVSEVMSQQTRIETVVPYYRRWISRFPNPGALAAADEQEVLSLWEGLGYYSRARNLHRTARELETRYGGEVPSDPEELRTLPGVGPYTAGAVASIAFGVPAPAVDGNVRRVLARLMDDAEPTPRRLRRWAAALVDPEAPGEFNQGLMELGSLVCTPRSPGCDRCPLRRACGARAAGTVAERPAPKKRGPVAEREIAVLVAARLRADREPELHLRRRAPEGLLAGMWEFPGAASRGKEAREAAAELAGRAGLEGPSGLEPLPVVRHAFSHLRATYVPFLLRVSGSTGGSAGPPGAGIEGGRWVRRGEAEELPVPVAQRAILRAAEERLSGGGAFKAEASGAPRRLPGTGTLPPP